jgi:hypothetical protein
VPAGGREGLNGLAHVATVSFLASRLAPSGQFWAALAGGIALARSAERHGLRAGYGASGAAMLETVALIGPARVNGPLTQALNAPAVGWLHGRGRRFPVLFAACLTIRLLHYVALLGLFVWLVIGGVGAYVETYDRIAGFLGFLPEGGTAALVLTVLFNLLVAAFYSAVQVVAYRRALRRWPRAVEDPRAPAPARPPRPARSAVAAVALLVATWALLLAAPTWEVLAAVGAAVALVVVVLPRGRRDGLRLGLVLGMMIGLGALGPALIGAVPFYDAARRALRALALVLTAACARSAVGADGVRALGASVLWSLRALPGAREASGLAAALRIDHRLAPAARDLVERMRPVELRPAPMADALTAWAAAEAAHGAPPMPVARP